MDTGATNHIAIDPNKLTTIYNMCTIPYFVVGDESHIYATNRGHSLLLSPYCRLYLHILLVTLNVIKNIVPVYQFTHDNLLLNLTTIVLS